MIEIYTNKPDCGKYFIVFKTKEKEEKVKIYIFISDLLSLFSIR